MRTFTAAVVGLSLSIGATAGPALARPAHPAARGCCTAQAGTVLEVELAEPISTKSQKSGDSFTLKLAAPLIVDGHVLLRAGTPGVGQIIEASKPGLGGKGGKLVLAARYLRRGRVHVPLNGMQMSGNGHDNSGVANAAGIGGLVFFPLGIAGIVMHGGDIVLPAGTHADAKIASDTKLSSLGRPSRAEREAAAEVTAAADTTATSGSIQIPPPPAGKGQVVFFRDKSIMGTGQWYTVHEGDQAVGKLTNGAYFVLVTDPGVHTYSASFEPEFKDKLRLEVDAGETYYVAGAMTKGVILGAADLTPSNRNAFNKASKNLKPAPPVGPEPPASDKPADQTTASPASSSAGPAPEGAAQSPPPAQRIPPA